MRQVYQVNTHRYNVFFYFYVSCVFVTKTNTMFFRQRLKSHLFRQSYPDLVICPSVCPSVCLSVRLSHRWISQKRLTV